VVSATTAAVAGGNAYADRLVPRLMRLAHRNALGYAGGPGIKLFPDALLNLHHWAFGEDTRCRGTAGTTPPTTGCRGRPEPPVALRQSTTGVMS